MRWKQKSEHLDKRTGTHYVVLHEPESTAEHHVPILLGLDACSHCGHVHGQALDEAFDPKARVAVELKALQDKHDAMEAYAKKHNIPVLTVDGKMRPAR